MTSLPSPPPSLVRQILVDQLVSGALYVITALDIPQLLAKQPQTAEALADATGTQAPMLFRLLRLLASRGLLRQEDEHFALTPETTVLLPNVPGSLAPRVLLGLHPTRVAAQQALLQAVRSGGIPYELANGVPWFTYLREHPDLAAVFNATMLGGPLAPHAAVVEGYTFAGLGTIVDVGGGHGQLLSAILRANSDVRGILFDTPEVVAGAPAVLDEAGVADRCTVLAGDFFQDIPPGGDVYVLSRILHDWNDGVSISILQACRRAMNTHARLLIVEVVVPDGSVTTVSAVQDIAMLLVTGGQERTEREFQNLLTASGFRLQGVHALPSGRGIVEAFPV